ncbi:hypothetical protein HK100_001275 [Physocladia obscura]|uniref:Uncharacterized protein n=1 Tax=Physocladia obscura TaxID=109957 RepID=A0AAD5SZ06_9FUNG|nr:hypothetical protein HK100_001275 [Physocladia obscura]
MVIPILAIPERQQLEQPVSKISIPQLPIQPLPPKLKPRHQAKTAQSRKVAVNFATITIYPPVEKPKSAALTPLSRQYRSIGRVGTATGRLENDTPQKVRTIYNFAETARTATNANEAETVTREQQSSEVVKPTRVLTSSPTVSKDTVPHCCLSVAMSIFSAASRLIPNSAGSDFLEEFIEGAGTGNTTHLNNGQTYPSILDLGNISENQSVSCLKLKSRPVG